MIEDYNGSDVIDATDQPIGTVERSYVDDTGEVRFVGVKMGGLRARHRLVPMDQIERVNDALRVPFGKDIVEASPDASSAGDTLEGETLDDVRAYYARSREQDVDTVETIEEPATRPANETQRRAPPPPESTTGAEGMADKVKRAVEQVREELPGASSGAGGDRGEASAGSIGQIRDLGDVIEVPIVEEVLVKRPVVKEVLRIRKSSVSERRTVSAEIRKEEVEVDKEPDSTR